MAQTKIIKGPGDTVSFLAKKMKVMQSESLSFGHYRIQGKHTSGMTYPELLALWAVGGPDFDQPPRNSREAARLRLSEWVNDPVMKKAFTEWSREDNTSTNPDQMLASFGLFLRDNYRTLFGVVGPHMPPDSTGTPLKETGELKSVAAYKVGNNKPVE